MKGVKRVKGVKGFTTLIGGLLLAALVVPLFAQQPTGRISGRVVDATTGEGVPHALVGYSTDRNRTRTSVNADAAGRFELKDVPAAQLYVSAMLTGYAGGVLGQRSVFSPPQYFDLAQGEHAADIVLRMWKLSAISGQVRDRSDRAVPGVEIRAYRLLVIAGRLGIHAGQMVTTDVQGRYVVPNVMPGRYVVEAEFGSNNTSPTPSRSGGAGAVEGVLQLPPVFYPGTLTAASATVVDVAEPRTNIDLKIPAFATVPVSGRIDGLASVQSHDVVELFRDDRADTFCNDNPAATSALSPGGAFTFPRVSPGKYVVRLVQFPSLPSTTGALPVAQTAGGLDGYSYFTRPQSDPPLPLPAVGRAPTWFVELPITVSAEPLAGVQAVARQGTRITGRVIFDGTAAKPSPDGLLRSGVIVSSPNGRALPTFPVARIEADGTFATVALPPGTYSVFPMATFGVGSRSSYVPAWSDSWRNRPIVVDGHTTPGSLFDLGTADVHVVITMSDITGRTALQGVVRDATGAVRSDASIYIVEADRRAWTSSRTAKELRPDRRGGYQVSLPPGDYLVTATLGEPELWRELSALDALMKSATRVHIDDGERRSQDLVLAERRQ